MKTNEGAPSPEFYLNVGHAVSCLTFHQHLDTRLDVLIAGLSNGKVLVFDCADWKMLFDEDIFDNGVLWLQTAPGDSGSLLFIQARFQGLKVFDISINNKIELREIADFYISHQGFCKGFIDNQGSDIFMFAPSQDSKLTVSVFKKPYIRPKSTLNPETSLKDEKFGSLMSCSRYSDTKILTAYENCQIILWDWGTNEMLINIPVPECGTVMSVVGSDKLGHCVVAGAENKIVVLKVEQDYFQVVKIHEATNSGIGTLALRPDLPILISGGWDSRIRMFSLKHPQKLKPLVVLDFHSEAVESLVVTTSKISSGMCKDKSLTAAGSKDGKISIWSLYS